MDRISIEDMQALIALAKKANITAGEAEAVAGFLTRIELAVGYQAAMRALAQSQPPAQPAPVADPPKP